MSGVASSQRGAVPLALAAGSGILAFLALGLLLIEAGRIWEARVSLQKAADAAALAGVQHLPFDPDRAQAAARDYAMRNGIGAGDAFQASVSQDNSTLSVSLRRRLLLFVPTLFPMPSVDVAASARAGLRSPAGAGDAMPWGLRQSSRVSAGYGSVVVLKYDAGDAAQGDFGALAVGAGGASAYRTAIVNGAPVTVGDLALIERGNMVGPTRQGLQERISATDPACDTFDEVFVRQGDSWAFRSERCNPWSPQGQASRRVMLVPVVTDQEVQPGYKRVLGLALVFFEGVVNCSGNDCLIAARFVQAADPNLGLPLSGYVPGSDLYTWGLVP